LVEAVVVVVVVVEMMMVFYMRMRVCDMLPMGHDSFGQRHHFVAGPFGLFEIFGIAVVVVVVVVVEIVIVIVIVVVVDSVMIIVFQIERTFFEFPIFVLILSFS
jgi:hypothetical protein